nr:hypothetical protein [Tanacetum cinerariifolium]
MINSIQNGDQPLPVIAQVSLAGNAQNQNQGDVNDALGYKKKVVMVISDSLALVAEKKSFENPSYFENAKDLRPSLYDEKVIGLGYTPMFLIHSDEALKIKKFKRARENKIEFAYDYRNLNASYVNEKINFSDDYCQEIINLDFEKIDSLFQQLKPYVSSVILENIIIDLEDEVTLLVVLRPKQSGVTWKKKGSSNTSNVDLSSVSHLKLNKNVKRYSRKDLLSCNNSHLGETGSAYVCNDAMNVFYNSRMCDLFKENNLFIFHDESVRISPVSKMPFRKKPRVSMNVRSKSNLNKSLPRTMHRWLPKIQPLSKICLWIIDLGCSKHMTGNRALLTNFVEKFFGTVRFGNNDFAMIADYGDAEAIATACFTQNRLIIHNRFDKTPYELINKRKPNIKFFRMFRCRCYLLNDYEDVGKLKAKGDIGVFVGYLKESAAFRIYNKRNRKIHESVNVNFDEISEMASKQFSLEPGLSNLKETIKSSNPSVSQGLETSKKDLEDLFQKIYDEYFDSSKIMKSLTTNVETSNVEVPSNEEEVFHESFESFQEESSSSSLNDDVQQSSKEVGVPSSNTQSI